MFRNTNNISNERGRLYSTPYDKSKSFLSRMKNAVQSYAPTWMQTFVNSEHVPQEEMKSIQNYGEPYGNAHLGIKRQNYDGRRIENHHAPYNTDYTQTSRFFDEQNEDNYLTKNKVVGSQNIYDKNDEEYIYEKQKRRRSENCIETIPEIISRPPLKRIALHKDDDSDQDSPITPQKDYFSKNKKTTYQNHKSTLDRKSYNSMPPLLHKTSATSTPIQKPATRVFMSNKGRTFVSKSPSQPTTPLFSKREDPGHDILMSPFYNRPIMFGGAMAYEGTMKRRQENKGGRSDMTTTSQRINNTINKLEESQRSETNSTINFPPLVYDSSLYKRMTLAPKSKNLGPPTKERLTPSLPAYNNAPIQTNIGGKMRREREKRHEMRRKDDDDGDVDEVQKQADAQLASIKLPPITFQTSSLFPNPPPTQPPSTTLNKPPRETVDGGGKKSFSFSTPKPAVRKFHFQEPIHISASQGNRKVQHNSHNEQGFSFKSPLRHTCRHKKSLSTSFRSSPHTSILEAAPVNFTSAKKKNLIGSKKLNGELKQGSVMDILGKSPLTTTTPATPATSSSTTALNTPLSVLFASKVPKWICPTCMVENKDDVSKCPCCETSKPATTVATQALFSKLSAPITKPSVPSPSTLVKASQEKVIPLTELFKTASAKGWECPVCMVANKEEDAKCPCCNEPKPPPKSSLPATATASKPIVPPTSSSFTSTIPASTPSQPPTILPTTTTTEESKVVMNSSGGFKFAISNSTTPAPSPFTVTTSSSSSSSSSFSTTKASEAASFGGFKPSSSTILSSNLPTNPTFSAPSSFGGFKFGATANQSLPTTSAPSFGSSFTVSKPVSTAPPPTQTTSIAPIITTTASSTFPAPAPFAFGMNKPTPTTTTTTTLAFGGSKPLFGTPIKTSLPTTTASFFGAITPANSSGFFASSSAPSSTPSKPIFQFGSSNALSSVATTTSATSSALPMFPNPASTTSSAFPPSNQLFGSTSNSLFSNNKTTSSSFFPVSNQFPSFSSTTTTATQNSFQLTTTNPISSSSIFPTNQTNSLFNKQENNNNNNNSFFNNSAFSSFNSSSTTTSTTASSLFPSNLANSGIFKFGAPQTTSTSGTGMFGSTSTTTSSSSLFQFGASTTSTSSSGFPANQQFSFSMGKQTEKRSFGGLANNEPDTKKAAGTFSFGGTNSSNNQGLSFSTSTAPSFQTPSAPSTFTFGQQNQPQQSTFQFGSQPQGSSVFAFGQSNQQQSTFNFNQQSTTMSFNQPTQEGSLNFSQVPTFNFTAGSNNPVFSAQNTTPIPGRTYKKATRRMRK